MAKSLCRLSLGLRHDPFFSDRSFLPVVGDPSFALEGGDYKRIYVILRRAKNFSFYNR
jgi:hypothetical protein